MKEFTFKHKIKNCSLSFKKMTKKEAEKRVEELENPHLWELKKITILN